MFLRIKQFSILLSLLSIGLIYCSYGITYNSIELISDCDSLSLSKKEIDELSKKLIDDPLSLVHKFNKCEHEIMCCADSVCNYEIMQKKIQINRQQNPIFLISECTSGMCGLSRDTNSTRSFYEKTVVSYLNKYKTKERINLVAFASGALFQELIILVRAVYLHNINNINIHLVDPSYGSFIEALSTIQGQSNAIKIDHYNNFNFHDYSLKKESEINMQQSCEKYLMIEQEMFRQFISCIKQFSDNKIKVFVHKSAEAYCEFCMQHPNMRADVISAMDLEPEIRYENAMKDYYKLMYHALKKGGVAILADNDLGPEKLNMIDYVANKTPNIVCLIQYLFYETTLKHIINLSQKTISHPMRHYNKFNTVFVGVHYKKEECLDEYLQNFDNALALPCKGYLKLNAELKKLDNNEFMTHTNEFKNISATNILSIGVMAIAMMHTADRMNLFSRI